MPDHSNLKKVYDKLIADGEYNLPATYEQFEADMSDNQNLQNFYTNLRKTNKYGLPTSFLQFKNDMGFDTQVAQPQNTLNNPVTFVTMTQQSNNKLRGPFVNEEAQQQYEQQRAEEQRKQQQTEERARAQRVAMGNTEVGYSAQAMQKKQQEQERERQRQMHENPTHTLTDEQRRGAYPGDPGAFANPFDFSEEAQMDVNKRVARKEVEKALPHVYSPELREKAVDQYTEEYAQELGTAADWERRRKEAEAAQKKRAEENVAESLANVDQMLEGARERATEQFTQQDDIKTLTDKDASFGSKLKSAFRLNATYNSTNPTAAARTAQEFNTKEVSELTAAQRKLKSAQNTIEEAQKHANDPQWLAEFGRGLKHGLTDISTWDFGITDLANSKAIQSALEKADKGEQLTESEQALLDAVATEVIVNEYFGSDISNWYQGGNSTAVSIPFMATFMISPAMTAGRSASAAMARYITKRFANKAVRGALKGFGRVGIDAVVSLGQTAMFDPIRIEADTKKRMMGDIVPTFDSEGNIKYGGHKGGLSEAEARGKATLSAWGQNASEMVGDYIPGAKQLFGSSKRVQRFMNNPFVRSIANMESRAQFHGFLPEMFEEVLNGVWDATLVGDMTLDADPEKGVFSKDNLGTTAISIGATSLTMGLLKLGGYGVSRSMLRKSDNQAAQLFGDEWAGLRERLRSDNLNDVETLANEISSSDKYSDEQKKAAIKYATIYAGLNAYAHMDKSPEQSNLDHNFDAGYEQFETPQAREELAKRYNGARETLRGMIGDETLARLDDDPLVVKAELDNDATVSDETRYALGEYVAAKAVIDGVKQRIEDDAEDVAEQQRNEAMSRVHKTDGMLHPATLKDGRNVYITDGNVVMREDGSVDHEQSDKWVIAIDANTGEVITDLNPTGNIGGIATLEEPQSVERIEQTIEQHKQDQIKAEQDAATGKFNPQPGQQIEIPNVGTATVLATDGETVTLQMPDGTQQSMAIAEIQQIADNMAMEDYRQRHPESVEQPTEQTPNKIKGVPEEIVPGMTMTVIDRDGNEKTVTTEGERYRMSLIDAGPYAGNTYYAPDEGGNFLEVKDEEGETLFYDLSGRGFGEVQEIKDYQMPTEQEQPTEQQETEQPTEEQEKAPVAEQPAELAQPTEAPVEEQPEESNTMPMRTVTTGKGKNKKTETVPDWYAVTPERAHTYIYNELGFTPEVADATVKANADEAAKAIAEHKKNEPKPTANPLAYKEAHDTWQNDFNTLQQQQDYWKQVQSIRNQQILAEQEAKDAAEREERERRRAETEAARQREQEAYEAEMERRRAEQERQKKELEARMNDMVKVREEQQTANVDFPIENDDEAMREINDLSPRTLEEVAAWMLANTTGKYKIDPSEIRKQSGYSTADFRKFPFVFAKRENGGMSPEAFGEKVEQIARENGVNFNEDEFRPGFNALMNVISETGSLSDLKNYIKNNRRTSAEQLHSQNVAMAASVQAEDKWVQQNSGMTVEQSGEYMNSMEQAVESGVTMLTDEETDALFSDDAIDPFSENVETKPNSNDTRTETNDEGGVQRGATESSTNEPEAEQTATAADDTRRDGEENAGGDDGRGGNGSLNQRGESVPQSDEIDENGHPFVKTADGSTTFGEIREESGLPAAPIKLSEGYQDENGKGYGLAHIEANHGDQIRAAGFDSVEEFVSYVAQNYDEDNIRVGKHRINGGTSYLIQVTDEYDNTLFIELSRDGSYWNVNSGGIFRKGYSNKKETVAKTEPQQPDNAVSGGSSLSAEEGEGITSTEPNGEPSVSVGKDTNISETDKKNVSSDTETEGKVLPYTITKTTYTTKKGKVIDVHLVKFDNELTKEQMKAAKEMAKEAKGWWSRENGGFMMRSEDDARKLGDAISNPDVVADAQPLSLQDMVEAIDQAQAQQPQQTNEQPQAEQSIEEQPKETSTYGADNKIVSRDRYEELKERMRKKMLGQLNAGIDPEILAIGTEMAAYHIEAGARKFTDFAKRMIADLGDAIRPYLKAFYNGVRDMPEMAKLEGEMTPYDDVRNVDVENFDKEGQPKDIIKTAQTIAKEQQVEKETEQAIDKLKTQRNEQRKQITADTEVIASEATIAASEVESASETASTKTELNTLEGRVNAELEKVNEQLALLGYYEADKVESDFNEAYGYQRNAEKKAVKDADKLAKRLAKDLGIEVGKKRLAQANIAPAGGDISFRLPLKYGLELYVDFYVYPDGYKAGYGFSDNLKIDDHIMYRIEDPRERGQEQFVSRNMWLNPDATYDEMLDDIRFNCKQWLPDVESKETKPADNKTEKKPLKKKDNKEKQELPLLDLFSGVEEEQEKAKSEGRGFVELVASSLPEDREQIKNGDTTFSVPETQQAVTAEQKAFSDAVTSDMITALATGEKPYRSIADLRKRAQSVGMTVDTEGRDDIMIQELVEDGLVRAAKDVVDNSRQQGEDSSIVYDKVCRLYDMQPTIAQRSSNRIKMQQYSTPLPMAYMADLFAWRDGKNVLEPTAGNGMLVFAIPSGNVVVNELDKTRLANLQGQGFQQVMNEDATTAEFGGPYDTVIANPPFGKADAKEYDGKSIAGLDEQITLNALSAMKDNGRAAIIIGGNMEYGKNGAITNNKAFWTYLYDHYNVKGVVDMDGKLYAKQGTTYPIRMILIDGRRSDEERTQTKVYPPVKDKAVRKAETFEDLYDIVNEINKSTQKTNGTEVLRSGADMADAIGQTRNIPVRGSSVEHNENATDERGNGRRNSVDSAGRNAGSGVRQTESKSGSRVRRPADTGLSGENKPISRNADRTTTETSGELAERKTGRDGLAGVQNVADGQRQRNGLEQTIKEKKARALDMEKLPYRPHNSAFSLESVAPAAMVEAMDNTLTEIEKTYRQSIDEFVTEQLGYDSIEEMHNALAAEQVDSVAMALHQMSQGNALIIGDQTGVGKGRQMAALIRWAVKVGKKPIFITQKADLFSDIYRDLVDVGSGDLRPFIFNSDGAIVDSNGNVVYKPMPSKQQAEVFTSGELPEGYDFAVLTYSQVNTGDAISQEQSKNDAKSSGRRGGKVSKAVKDGKKTPKATFLRNIAKDNYLFLDESHTAAGDSNVGAYIRSIIGMKGDGAKAVTFASATFAKRPDTMPMYALRTAMSEANIEQGDLIGIIEKGGVTLQEIMSRALTESGQMVRRERDMSDVRTDWETVSDAATVKRARENYDKTIEAFNAIIRFQEMYVKPMIEQLSADLAERQSSANVKKGTDKMGVENVPFASKTYNYTKQLMLALKADAIVDRVAQEIKAGRRPVIALESTMEASLKDYAIDEVIEEPTFSASLLRGLDTVMQYTVKDEDGNESHMRYQPSALGIEGERAYYELQNFIREATKDVFISPLDAIIEKLHERGYKVGELTGRNTYAERDSEGNVVVKRRTDKDKKRMQREFNNGTLDVLILNKSASTGISLHASKNFDDKHQRSMIIAQPLSDINDYMQMIGRIDRTGQVHRGYYINLGLPVPAESRFLMMLSTKLKSLNANTTTSQESESNSVDAPDLLNKYGSQVVVEYLRDNPDIYIKMGDPLKLNGNDKSIEEQLEEYKPSKDDTVARKITGYVALLSTAEQEAFYNDVVQRYTDLIKYLDSTGTNDLKITVMPLKAKTLRKKVSSEGKDPNGNNPFAGNAYVEEVEMDVLRKPMKAEEVRKTIEQLNKPTGSEKGRLATASKEKAVGERVLEIVGQVQGEADAKMQAENERYEAAKVKAAADIAKYAEKINGQQRTAEEKADAIARYTEETNEKVEKRHTENVNVIKARASKLVQSLQDFTVGSTYLLPQSTDDAEQQQMFRTPAIFCGFKVKKNGITPSTSFAVFATLDGRRRVEVKFTDNTAIEGIRFVTDSNWNEVQSITLDNWDSQIPTDTRKKGYIMTGNILQAVADTQDEFGNYPGQLISYSDIDGNIHDGILMPDQWNPGLLRTSGVPIIAKLSDIKKFNPVESQDGKVEITGSEWSGQYYLTVPKSKKDGGVYFENEKLLSLINSYGFYPYRGKLRADIRQSNIEKVVRELDRLGVRVKGEEDGDIMFRSLDPESDNVVDNAEVGTRPLSDREKVAKLEAEPKVKVYRSMQLIDGKLYPPMSAKSEGQLREPSEIGVWEEADERPDMADSNGKFTLNKGNGKSLKAAYNPYIHTSRTMLNDQFSEAQDRPNLVVVEMEVPESELTSGYKAEKAKDSVGAKQWKAGVIQGQLSGTREVILSRWAKPVRIVPAEEVAENIARQIEGQVEVMPSNVVTPDVKAALEERGVQFVETDNTGKIKEGTNKGKTWASVYGKKSIRGREADSRYVLNPYAPYNTYEESLAASKAAGYTKRQHDAMVERRRKNYAERGQQAKEMAEKLNLGNRVEILENADGLEERFQNKKGWYNPRTGKITVVLDKHGSMDDILQTILHEGVGHHGLREMFGKAFDNFLENVYNAATPDIRHSINLLVRKNDWDYRKATEEYLAQMAETMDFEKPEVQTWWQKVKAFFIDMLHKLGIKGAFAEGSNAISDNELRYILWRSYQNLVNPGRYRSFVDMANDVVMQDKLKVGNYEETSGDRGAWYEPAKAAESSAVAEGEDYERRDREYADAVENGDKDKVKKLITEAADEAMPNSKVRDKKGNLRVMYHGTVSDNQFTKFDGDIYMFAKPDLADQYTHKRRALSVDPKQSGRVMPVFVNLENPLEVDAKRHLWRNIDVEWSDKPISTEDIVKYAKENGYDGVIIKNVRDNMFDNDTSYSDEVIAFDSSQVKSTGPTYEQTRRSHFPWDTYDEMKEVYGATYDDNGDMIPLSERFNNDNDDIRFREEDEVPRAVARESYENMVASAANQFKEATQDSMLSLKNLYKAIMNAEGDKRRIEEVEGYQNAYLAENRMHSANEAEAAVWQKDYMEPITKAINNLTNGDKKAYDDLIDYMMAKHGLERNRVFAERDAQAAADKGADYDEELQKNRGRDYAGLTALTGESDVAIAEGMAQKMVDDYEAAHDTTELWEKVNRATKHSLYRIADSGMMTLERYEQIRDMFDYYIPLQGFDETIAEDVYAYLGNDGTLGYGTPIRAAKGRKSKADDPIATISMNGEAAIRMANRNEMKKNFLNFVEAHPSDLVSVSEVWLKYDDVTGQWEQVTADLDENDSPSDVERKTREFDEKMQSLSKNDPDHYKKSSDIPNVPFRVVQNGNMKQHQITVMRGGKRYVITINGSPRAAQAINGLTNPDVNTEGVFGKAMNLGQWLNRQLSAFYTTRNPEFMLSNFLRDAIYSNSMAWVKESPNYAIKFHKNFGKMNPVQMGKLFAEWKNGKLRKKIADGIASDTEKMFNEFMMNGGETGWTSLRDIEKHKKAIQDAMKREGNLSRRAWKGFWGAFDLMNRSVENCARFAAYVTSREMGRSIDRSIWDAKEVSVNFNKKGAGDKFLTSKNQKALGQLGAAMGGLGRGLYVFFNASMQGLNNIARASKRNPWKATGLFGTLFMLGAIAPILAEVLSGGDGDDDDKNDYYNLPEYIRRSNLVFRWSKDMPWITLPLPIEYRAIYGLGELATGVLTGKERYSDEEFAKQFVSQLSQVLPLDFMEGGGGWHAFVPSQVKPLVEANQNVSWTGLPIYRETKPWNENNPQWTRAYDSANKQIVNGTKWLNEVTGGDNVTQGYIDWNPAKIEYMLKGYLGGYFTMYDRLQKTAETALGNREFEWRNIPMASRVLKEGDERTEARKITNEYYDLLNEYKQTNSRLKGYKKMEEAGTMGSIERANYISLMNNSKEYRHYLLMDTFKPILDAYYDMGKEAEGEDKRRIKHDENAVRGEFVRLIHAIDDGKDIGLDAELAELFDGLQQSEDVEIKKAVIKSRQRRAKQKQAR